MGFDWVARNTHRDTPSQPQTTMPKIGAMAEAAVPTGQSWRQPMLLKKQPRHGRHGSRCAELAGGTTADCVSVCCCGPFFVVDLLVLTAVRLPAGICRRAIRKARLRKRKEAGLLGAKCCAAGGGDESSTVTGDESDDSGDDDLYVFMAEASPAEMEMLEKELWAHFHGAGFWRSPSQRESQE